METDIRFVTTQNRAGLSCETNENAYWIWAVSSGQTLRHHNGAVVPEFGPEHRKARGMEAKFRELESALRGLLRMERGTAKAAAEWWRIKAVTEGQGRHPERGSRGRKGK